MKINVNTNKDINNIKLAHDGMDISYMACITNSDHCMSFDLDNPLYAEITFSDMYEVDCMINMLEKFKARILEIKGEETWA